MDWIEIVAYSTVGSLGAVALVRSLRLAHAAFVVVRKARILYDGNGHPVIGAKLRLRASRAVTGDATDGTGDISTPVEWGRRFRVDVLHRRKVVRCDVEVILTTREPFTIIVPCYN